jgi:hypothetical protein
MVALIFLIFNLVASLFKSKSRLEAENAALRHQLTVLQRKIRGRVQFTNTDRVFFIQLYRWCPSVLKAMLIIRPETLVRWHRAGLRRYWRWKSRCAGGRPQIHAELRALIWRMSVDNRLWGAPHIHGELLKLGFAVAQSTVAKYMAKRRKPSGQSWEPWASAISPLPRLALAECIRRETDRHDPTGMSRPHDRVRGAAPTTDPRQVCCLL